MRIIEIMSLLMRKGLMAGSPPSSLSNCLIALDMFPTLQLKMPLEMDSLWTIPTMMTSLTTTTTTTPDADADYDTAHDLPFTSSGIVDVNNIAEIPDATTLNRLAQLKGDITANVITGSKVLNQYDCDTYFTSAFPTLFPCGTEKHQDSRRETKQLPLLKWVSLMPRHSSRSVSHIFPH